MAQLPVDGGLWRYSGTPAVVAPRSSLGGGGGLQGWIESSKLDVRRLSELQAEPEAIAEVGPTPSLRVRPRRPASAPAVRRQPQRRQRQAPPGRRPPPGTQQDVGDGWVKLRPSDPRLPAYFWQPRLGLRQWQNPVQAEDPGAALLRAAAVGEGALQELGRVLKLPGLDVNVRDAFGRSALEMAAGRGCAGAVALLLRYGGVELESTNRLGRTALHAACLHAPVDRALGDSGCIGLLLRAGAPMGCEDREGLTARELVERGQDQGVRVAAGPLARTAEQRQAVLDLLLLGPDLWEAGSLEDEGAGEAPAEASGPDDSGEAGGDGGDAHVVWAGGASELPTAATAAEVGPTAQAVSRFPGVG
jgi:hypothetical protein